MALEGGEESASRPGRSLPPGKDPVPIVQEAGWAPGPVWTGAKNLAPPGFDPRTIQPVASRYTDWGPMCNKWDSEIPFRVPTACHPINDYTQMYTGRTLRYVRQFPFEICFVSRMHIIGYIWHPFRFQDRTQALSTYFIETLSFIGCFIQIYIVH